MKKEDIEIEDILADKPENELMEVPLTSKVFKAFLVVLALIFLIILAQFINVGIIDHNIYNKSAFANIAESKIKPAPRGIIKDRFGDIIVDNVASFRAFLSPQGLPKDSKSREESLKKISEILKINYKDFKKKINNHDWRLGKLLLKKDLSHNELVSLSSKDIAGLEVQPGFTRVSKENKAYSHIVGYTGLVTEDDLKNNHGLVFQDEIGKSGLELEYDEILRGQNGKEISFMNAQMEVKEERVVAKPKRGEILNLFIDSGLQEYLYQRLQRQVEELGAEGGVGIAINPQNGEVLALTNVPSFEIDKPAEYLSKPNQPFFNRAVSGLYNPGSTIKPLVAIAALEEGIVKPSKSFLSTGELVVSNPYNPDQPSVFKDWKRHGWVNLHSALARSSNVYFYIVGGGYKDQEGLGISQLHKWWQKFNINKKTQIDLPEENTGFLPTSEWKKKKYDEPWRLGDTYNVSIGQGQLVTTPLELLNYVSAIANGGKINKLRIAENQKSKVIKDIGNDIKSALPDVKKGMFDCVDKDYGTAHYLNTLPINVAAKTGTAQVGGHETNALFVGFTDYQDSQIALLVLIEDAKEGGLNAVPVANDVFYWYYQNRLKESS